MVLVFLFPKCLFDDNLCRLLGSSQDSNDVDILTKKNKKIPPSDSHCVDKQKKNNLNNNNNNNIKFDSM